MGANEVSSIRVNCLAHRITRWNLCSVGLRGFFIVNSIQRSRRCGFSESKEPSHITRWKTNRGGFQAKRTEATTIAKEHRH